MYHQDIANALDEASIEGLVVIPNNEPRSNCETFGDVSLIGNPNLPKTLARPARTPRRRDILNIDKLRIFGL